MGEGPSDADCWLVRLVAVGCVCVAVVWLHGASSSLLLRRRRHVAAESGPTIRPLPFSRPVGSWLFMRLTSVIRLSQSHPVPVTRSRGRTVPRTGGTLLHATNNTRSSLMEGFRRDACHSTPPPDKGFRARARRRKKASQKPSAAGFGCEIKKVCLLRISFYIRINR